MDKHGNHLTTAVRHKMRTLLRQLLPRTLTKGDEVMYVDLARMQMEQDAQIRR
ncbi:MAG: hypothetical protein WCW01_00090 [Gammaproteobacteria bacterium]|jgi:hypothetical protein